MIDKSLEVASATGRASFFQCVIEVNKSSRVACHRSSLLLQRPLRDNMAATQFYLRFQWKATRDLILPGRGRSEWARGRAMFCPQGVARREYEDLTIDAERATDRFALVVTPQLAPLPFQCRYWCTLQS